MLAIQPCSLASICEGHIIGVVRNICYNDAQAKKTIYYENNEEISKQVMRSKSGVCQHFSELFARLARYGGLEIYVVNAPLNLYAVPTLSF